MDQLMAITRGNPGLVLSDDDQRRAQAGVLLQVGQGAIIPTGPVVIGTGGGATGQPKGCIDYLRFQKSSEDLAIIIVDGNTYSGGNLNEFRDVLLEAALHMKCVSFCWDTEKREMTMLNVHPRCCCRCKKQG